VCFRRSLPGARASIRDHPTAARSPWQNGHAERLIGSICRECLDQIVVFGGAHLRRILAAYTGYYNELRTHLSLEKDSPTYRSIQLHGQLAARPILGGLHHQLPDVVCGRNTLSSALPGMKSRQPAPRIVDTVWSSLWRSASVSAAA